MQLTGAALQKPAVPCMGVRRQAEGGQTGLLPQIAFAKGRRHRAGRQTQPPRQPVQVIPGQHKIPPSSAAVPTACADKGKRFLHRQRCALQRLPCPARFHVHSTSSSHSRHSGSQCALWALGVFTSGVQMLSP